MSGDLGGSDPLRQERSVVAQRVITSAEILAAEIRARIAVQRVVRIVDRAGVDARILQERGDERLTRAEVVGQLSGAEVAMTIRCDDLANTRPGQQGVVDRIADGVEGTEEP